MKAFILTIALILLAGSALSASGVPLMTGMDHCDDMAKMSSSGTSAKMAHHDHGHAAKHNSAKADDDCPEDCCDGVCTCKASISSVAAMVPDLLRQAGEILPMNVLPEAVDALLPVLHLLMDPPPRSHS